MVDSTTYLIDANALITPFRQYYAFDICPSFWEKLSVAFKEKRIILLDKVKDEILKGNDELTDWLKENEDTIAICKFKTDSIISNYQAVLQYVFSCGLYKESAISAWAQASAADPWLIATAMSNEYIIVTSERPSGGLSEKSPNAAAKIPDVAKAMGVSAISLFDMMRNLSFVM